jgi:hypothetical protein
MCGAGGDERSGSSGSDGGGAVGTSNAGPGQRALAHPTSVSAANDRTT